MRENVGIQLAKLSYLLPAVRVLCAGLRQDFATFACVWFASASIPTQTRVGGLAAIFAVTGATRIAPYNRSK